MPADTMLLGFAGCAVGILSLMFLLILKIASSMGRLERKLNRLLEASHLEINQDYPEVLDLLQQGKKIQAIKRYRELTGTGLAEAKEAVERME